MAKKKCLVCGAEFTAPPTGNKTCSYECSIILRQRTHNKHTVSKQTRQKISKTARETRGDKMGDLQKVATEAAKKSPNSGRFVTNVNAMDWELIAPDGKRYKFHSLNNWVRENYMLFGEPEYNERIVNNIRSGLTNAKRGAMGKKSPAYMYKGWRVVPTQDDEEKREKEG